MYINIYIYIHVDLCTYTNTNTTRERQYYLLSAGPAAKAGAAAAAAAAGVRDVPAIAPVFVDTHSHQYEQEAARQQIPSVSVYKHNMLNVWMINTHTRTHKNLIFAVQFSNILCTAAECVKLSCHARMQHLSQHVQICV